MNEFNDEKLETKNEEKESIFVKERGLFGVKRYRLKWKYLWPFFIGILAITIIFPIVITLLLYNINISKHESEEITVMLSKPRELYDDKAYFELYLTSKNVSYIEGLLELIDNDGVVDSKNVKISENKATYIFNCNYDYVTFAYKGCYLSFSYDTIHYKDGSTKEISKVTQKIEI